MKKIYILSIICYCLLFAVNIFGVLSSNINIILSSIIIFSFLISSIYLAKGFQKYISIIFFLVGSLISLKYKLDFPTYHYNISKGFTILILFLAIPFVAIPLKYGQYLESISDFIQSKKENPGILFFLLTILYIIIAIPLNIGSIPTMQNLINEVKFPKKYLAMLYTAGYSSYMVFSPFDGVVNMVLILTSINYSEYFLKSIIMVLTILGVSTLILITDKKLIIETKNGINGKSTKCNYHKLLELILNIIFLILLAFLGEKYIKFSNNIFIIAVLIIGYSLIWLLFLKPPRIIWENEKKMYYSRLLSYKNFLLFLITANFLGSMIAITNVKEYIFVLLGIANTIPTYFMIQSLILLTILLSLCGIHMMITITTLAYIVTPGAMGLTNSSFALTLLTCWYLAMSISPFVPFSSVVSETIGEKVSNITFKYNIKFVISMFIISPLIIVFLN